MLSTSVCAGGEFWQNWPCLCLQAAVTNLVTRCCPQVYEQAVSSGSNAPASVSWLLLLTLSQAAVRRCMSRRWALAAMLPLLSPDLSAGRSDGRPRREAGCTASSPFTESLRFRVSRIIYKWFYSGKILLCLIFPFRIIQNLKQTFL